MKEIPNPDPGNGFPITITLMNKNLFLFVLVFGLHASALAGPSSKEIAHRFVEKMNSFFGLEVEIQAHEVCGFRFDDVGPVEDGKMAILYCEDELIPFDKFQDQKVSSSNLKFIFAHEYAHILINNHLSEAGLNALIERMPTFEKFIVETATKDPERKKLFETLTEFSESQIPDLKPDEIVDFFGFLLNHENVDSLGAKIMMMLGEEVPQAPLKEFSKILGHEDSKLDAMIGGGRDRMVQASVREGLKNWNSLHCTEYAWSDEGSAKTLKRIALEKGYDGIHRRLSVDCTAEEAADSFYQSLARFFR